MLYIFHGNTLDKRNRNNVKVRNPESGCIFWNDIVSLSGYLLYIYHSAMYMVNFYYNEEMVKS